MSPLVYARNRASGAATAVLERLARGTGRKNGPAPSRWATESLPAGRAVQHPDLEGLWFVRNAVEPAGVAALRRLVDGTMLPPRPDSLHAQMSAADREVAMLRQQRAQHESGTEQHTDLGLALGSALADRQAVADRAGPSPPVPPLRGRTRWEWYTYEPARYMAPCLPHPDDCAAPTSVLPRLEGFEVFGRAPVREWLGLSELAVTDEQAGRDGARRLRALTRELSSALAAAGGEGIDALQAVFLQLQLLGRGAAVSSHVDAADPPADVVATVSLGEGAVDTVRVGHVVVPLQIGDCYAIGGHARWAVEHEVHPSWRDRLSLTFRFLGAARGAQPVSFSNISQATASHRRKTPKSSRVRSTTHSP